MDLLQLREDAQASIAAELHNAVFAHVQYCAQASTPTGSLCVKGVARASVHFFSLAEGSPRSLLAHTISI